VGLDVAQTGLFQKGDCLFAAIVERDFRYQVVENDGAQMLECKCSKQFEIVQRSEAHFQKEPEQAGQR